MVVKASNLIIKTTVQKSKHFSYFLFVYWDCFPVDVTPEEAKLA